MYVVLMANCDDRTGTIHIGGHSEWKNPYGERDALPLPLSLLLSLSDSVVRLCAS